MDPLFLIFCKFPTSLADGHLYQAIYHQRMGRLRLFFLILVLILEYSHSFFSLLFKFKY